MTRVAFPQSLPDVPEIIEQMHTPVTYANIILEINTFILSVYLNDKVSIRPFFPFVFTPFSATSQVIRLGSRDNSRLRRTWLFASLIFIVGSGSTEFL